MPRRLAGAGIATMAQPMTTPSSPASAKTESQKFTSVPKLALTLMVGVLGGLALYLVGFPAAWLTGSAVAVAILAISGHAVMVPQRLQQLAFLLIGVSMGGGMSPDTLERISEWPASIVLLVVLIMAATLASYQILTRYGGWDRVTAMCGAIPGNLSLVVATALEQGAATERVAIAHTLRLLVLLVVVPPAVALVATETVALARPASAGLIDTLILLAGGLLIGSFMASGALHAFGVVETVLPRPIVGGALVLLGTAIGARFAGVSLATFLHVLLASTASLTAGLLVCLVPAAGFALVTGLALPQVLLAFAPGGIEAMITLAFVLDSDVPYVAALHMIRVVTLAIALPLLLRFVASDRDAERPR